jgi:hypothetical protein
MYWCTVTLERGQGGKEEIIDWLVGIMQTVPHDL